MEEVNMKKKRLSPFSKDFWIEKGYSEEQAEYKRNSIRPIRKEYWLEKGYSEEEAIIKAKETKNKNNKKGAHANASRSKEDQYKSSPRRIEYWLEKGYSEKEAKNKISEVQKTFSLEKCVEKHGILEGYNIWKKRQEKWQNALSKKSDKEILDINKRKNAICINNFETIQGCIENLKASRNMTLFDNEKDYANYIKEKVYQNPYLKYYPLDLFIQKNVSNVQKQIFEALSIDIRKCLSDIIIGEKFKDYLVKKGKKQSYRMWTEEGLLRSSYEIYFYEKIKEKYPDLYIEIDGNYKESSFRYDFKMGDTTIEICPMYNSDENYRKKMDKKKKLFGCIFLKSISEINEYIDAL